MALPRLNETPSYVMRIPSTGKEVKYRPYLVKEEKILMMANESGDLESIVRAMTDTICACVTPELNPKTLSTFDLEYLFLQIRSVSVGETSTVYISCTECETQNEVVIDLKSVGCKVPKRKNKIKISDDIELETKYPSYSDFDYSKVGDSESFIVEEFLSNCIKAVCTKEERLSLADESKEEIVSFIESLTSSQIAKLQEYVMNIPTISTDTEFTCTQCEKVNKNKIQGITNFF